MWERRLLPPPISPALFLPFFLSFSSTLLLLFTSKLVIQLAPGWRHRVYLEKSGIPISLSLLVSSPATKFFFSPNAFALSLFSLQIADTDTTEHLRGQTAGNHVFYRTPGYNAISFVLRDDASLAISFRFVIFKRWLRASSICLLL